MSKIYKYRNVEYRDEQGLREAIWSIDRKVLPKCYTAADWARFDVVVVDQSQLTKTTSQEHQSAEQLAHHVLMKRHRMLQDSDYYMMSDYPSTKQGLADVKAYRQALRDITTQPGYPTNVEWPVKPEVLE